VGDKDLNETLADWENCDRRGENVSEALQKLVLSFVCFSLYYNCISG
jgi:hypothetical protein